MGCAPVKGSHLYAPRRDVPLVKVLRRHAYGPFSVVLGELKSSIVGIFSLGAHHYVVGYVPPLRASICSIDGMCPHSE